MNYIIGKITYIGKTYVLLENNFIGYKINFINDGTLEVDKYKKIYICEKWSISNNFILNELYGFINLKDKIFFEKLISISGIGYKTAFNIMKNDIVELKRCILNGDINELSKFNGISTKIANSLISQIKIEDSEVNYDNNKKNYKQDIISTLKALGYNSDDIDRALNDKYSSTNFYLENEDELTDIISSIIKDISINV